MQKQKVVIVGLGAIGKTLARELAAGIPGYVLEAVAGRDPKKTQTTLKSLGLADVRVIEPVEAAEVADIVLDAAPAAAFRTFAEPTIRAGKTLVAISVGALLEHSDLIDVAQETGAVIHVPSGAIAGLDGVRAAAEGDIYSAKIITKKPAGSLVEATSEGAPEATQLFAGTVREAFALFPANVNVAVALSFAGIGPDRTQIEVWADPDLTVNTHNIVVESDAGTLNVTVANHPGENPKTAFITGQSIIALLRKNSSQLRIGT